MELHPFLEPGQRMTSDLWYVLSQDAVDESDDSSPSQRVGHTMTYLPPVTGDIANEAGNVYLLGGANPDGAFNDVFCLNLSTFTWSNITKKCESKMDARYEHSSFRSSEHDASAIYVYAGAHRSNSHNNIQRLDTTTNTWTTIETCTSPTPRTYHTEQCVSDDGLFVVYSGGHKGSDPIGDRQVHLFDIKTHEWSVMTSKGDSPKPRHGHCVLSVGSRVYVHGGMSGNTFYGDLYYLDLLKQKWTEVKHKRSQTVPCPRSAHSGVAMTDSKAIVIFGGMTKDGALDDLYSLNLDTHQWTQIMVQGPSPTCRLDMSMCIVELPLYANINDAAIPENKENEDIVVLGRQAKECLDTEFSRFSSASSSRSVASSVGSISSLQNGENTIDLPILPNQRRQRSSRHSSLSSVDESVITNEAGVSSEEGSTFKGQTMCSAIVGYQTAILLFGGMDTLGEMFNDCMVITLSK